MSDKKANKEPAAPKRAAASPSPGKRTSAVKRRTPAARPPQQAGASLVELEQQYQTALDLAAVGVAFLAPDLRVLHANETICEIMGFGQKELAELTFTDLTHHEDRAADLRGLDQLARGAVQTATREKRIVRKDGFTVWVNSTVTAIRHPDGAVRQLIAVVEDITGRKRMEDVLQLLRKAVESLPLGITMTDLDGRIMFVNPAEARMHGYAVDELLGREARILAPAQQWSSESLRELLAKDLVNDTPYTREAYNLRRDGTVFPVVISSIPVRDMRGTPLALVSTSEDITDRRRMLDALQESELKHRTLFESANDAIFIADHATGILTDCNIRACELLGMTRDEIIGRDLGSLFPPDEARGYAKRLAETAEGRARGIFYDSAVQRKDGTRIGVDISATLFSVRGKHFLMGIFRDATERKKAERVISQAKRDWEETFDTITDAITIHDGDFTILRSNKAAARILGLPWLEVGRAKCYEYFHGSETPPESCPSCRCLQDGGPVISEMFEPHLGRYLEVRAIPRLDASGAVVGLIHVVRDITGRKTAEQERAALEARLHEAERMEVIGNLAGGVAHEVRNPLNAIMALTDALDQELGGDAAYRTFIGHMRTQVERLTTLMNDLLELGKPVEEAKLRREPLTEICALSIDAWKQSKWGGGREVALAGPPAGEALFLRADGKKLQQVFINLLDNASQHSPEGSPLRIEIVQGHGNTAQVRVIDRGSGIPADALPRVFDTFFTTRRGGTGLGLSIVKHIVEKHGGAVSLSNNDPPPGCTATVILPVEVMSTP
jgi:PAS domain S-box-containing protein